jgi:c-di-GMP-binding flagellar brake protein YcgR
LTIKIPIKEDPIKTIDVFSGYELAIDRNTFLITAPMQGMILYPLHPREHVVITYLADSAVFETHAITGERMKKGDLNYLVMHCDGYVVRNQRRNDFRVDTAIETYMFRALETNPSLAEEEPIKSLVSNLSAGGAAVYTDERPDVGDPIHLNLPPAIFGNEKTLMAQVHWVRRLSGDYMFKHHIGVRFLFSSPVDREDLRKYVWEFQRELIRGRK